MSDHSQITAAEFRKCSACAVTWNTQRGFLSDPAVEMIGYQVNFRELEAGFFLFNHLACKTTIAIEVAEFKNLQEGTVYPQRLTGTEECEEYCLHQEELRPCPEACECASVREIIRTILSWKKDRPSR